jgi:hypothetical protein
MDIIEEIIIYAFFTYNICICHISHVCICERERVTTKFNVIVMHFNEHFKS